MLRLVVSRAIQSAGLMILVSIVTFALLRMAPGDPAALLYGPNASPKDLAQVRERWGLDDPIAVQYLRWLGNASMGDLGRSYSDGRPVSMAIAERVPATLLLTGTAVVISTLLGMGTGLLAARSPYGRMDRIVSTAATLFYSTPPFWLGLLLVMLFSVQLGWLPSGGLRDPLAPDGWIDLPRHLLLPAVTLALRDAGRLAAVSRASILETMGEDFIRTAVAKGLPPSVVLTRHVLRSSLLPVLTVLGMSTPGLLGGAVVVETLFGWPGMGRLAIEAALQRNYPVIMGEVLVVASLAVLGSLLADISYALADPRVRRQKGA